MGSFVKKAYDAEKAKAETVQTGGRTGQFYPGGPNTSRTKITPSTGVSKPTVKTSAAPLRGAVGVGSVSPVAPVALGGGGGGGGAAAPDAGAFLSPDANPAFLAALANIDASEAGSVSDIRAKQDAARRALNDVLADIADRQVVSNQNTLDSQETRGLYHSGATERLIAEVAKAAGADRARGQSNLADNISDLERAIAQAHLASDQARASARLEASGGKGIL